MEQPQFYLMLSCSLETNIREESSLAITEVTVAKTVTTVNYLAASSKHRSLCLCGLVGLIHFATEQYK